MKAILAGPREYDDFPAYCALIESCPWKDAIEAVLSGACRLDESVGSAMPPFAQGADGCGERWAVARGIPVQRFFAQWRVQGHPGIDRSAGPRRNRVMAEIGDGLIASADAPPYLRSGTWNMIAEAVRFGLEIWVPERYRIWVSAMEAHVSHQNPDASADTLIRAVLRVEAGVS